MEEELYPILWAKSEPYKSLWSHLRETAIVSKTILQYSNSNIKILRLGNLLGLSDEEALRLIMYLSGLHDLGKLHPLFLIKSDSDIVKDFLEEQKLKYPNSNLKATFRHERESEQAAIRIWENTFQFADEKTRKSLAAILRLHHQGKEGCAPSLIDEEWPQGMKWVRQQEIMEARLRKWIQPPSFSIQNARQADAGFMLMLAIVIMSDWIASGNMLADTTDDTPENEIENRTKDFLNQAGLLPANLPCYSSFCSAWPQIRETQKRPLQNHLDQFFSKRENQELPLLMILEAPMGEGKTEAGIYAALKLMKYWGKDGFYIALPTAATANQMESRINRFLEIHGGQNAKLLHSAAWLSDPQFVLDEKGEQTQAELWLTSSKRALLAPTAVGTVDQAMMAAMRIKYGVLRLEGLAGKVLIIDEIHAYDAYMTDIILKLLAWCKAMGVPVIMLSATLPAARKERILKQYSDDVSVLSAYPLITAAYRGGKTEQESVYESYQNNEIYVQLAPILHDAGAIARMAVSKVREGGCICVLMNTVKEAQAVYRELKRNADADTKLLLFHSRFSMARRNQIEQQCIRLFGPGGERPEKAILVATQVVEQSLDIDMDGMITAIAPVDLLLQRMGRMHRHKETFRPSSLSRPVFTVLVPAVGEDYGLTGEIYYQLLLQRTYTCLEKICLEKNYQISIPNDLKNMVEFVYDETCRVEDDLESFLERSFQDELKEGESGQIELDEPKEKGFGMRWLTQAPIFGDDEDGFLPAKTRLGEESEKLAVLPAELYEKIKTVLDEGRHPDIRLSRKILLYSVSVPKRQLRKLFQHSRDGILTGTGRLYKVIMVRCDNEEIAAPESTLTAQIGGTKIQMDSEFGFFIEQEGESRK